MYMYIHTFSYPNTLDSSSSQASLGSDFKECKCRMWRGESGGECEGETMGGVRGEWRRGLGTGEVCRIQSRMACRDYGDSCCHLVVCVRVK